MKKKEYTKPAMLVYNLQSPEKILAGSGNGGMNALDPYENGGDPLNPTMP